MFDLQYSDYFTQAEFQEHFFRENAHLFLQRVYCDNIRKLRK